MADELNIPTHRWYQKRNHVALAKEDVSRQYIYDSGIQKIDAWINSQPWGDVYIVNRLSPNLVFDFDATYFRTDGTATDLVSAATHTRAGNATMVDSDGSLKWAPHNLVLRSEEFDNASWAKDGSTVSQVSGAEWELREDATIGRKSIQGVGVGLSGGRFVLEVKPNGRNFVAIGSTNGAGFWSVFLFNLATGAAIQAYTAGGVLAPTSPEIAPLENGFFRVAVTLSTADRIVAMVGNGGDPIFEAYLGDGTSGLIIRRPRLYRSDLGGMVNNPDRGDSYVPTTSAAVYLPRVGHHIWDGSAWVDEGYFHESEARTNLFTYSEDFTNAAWIKSSTATLAIDATGPDGETSAVTLVDDSAGGSGIVQVYRNVTVATSTAHTFSVFAKADQLSWVGIYKLGFTTPSEGITYFDLGVGDIGSVGPGDIPNIENCGGGWYRCSITFTTDAADTSGTLAVRVCDENGNVSVDFDGTSSILIYGAQLEAGSTPSSYIPTADATVTRAADAMTIPAANLPWNPLAVSLQMEGTMTYADTDNSEEVSYADWTLGSTRYIRQVLNTVGSRTGALNFVQREDASGLDFVQSTPTTFSPGINVPFNFASRHGSTFINGAVDGTALTANLTPTALPDLSATDMDIGSDFMGTIKQFRVWADDITDAGIEEASA